MSITAIVIFSTMKVKLRNAISKEVVVDISKCNETEVLFALASKEFGFSLEYTCLIFRGCLVSTFNLHDMCIMSFNVHARCILGIIYAFFTYLCMYMHLLQGQFHFPE